MRILYFMMLPLEPRASLADPRQKKFYAMHENYVHFIVDSFK